MHTAEIYLQIDCAHCGLYPHAPVAETRLSFACVSLRMHSARIQRQAVRGGRLRLPDLLPDGPARHGARARHRLRQLQQGAYTCAAFSLGSRAC